MISKVHLTRLTNLLSEASKGRYGRDKAILIRDAARNSIGSYMPAKELELKHTLKLIQELNSEIDEIEDHINEIMAEMDTPILTIPGISNRMGAMILAEIGDYPPPPINQGSSPRRIRTWRKEVLVICGMHYLMRQNSFAIGIRPSLIICKRRGAKVSITMWQYHTPVKSL